MGLWREHCRVVLGCRLLTVAGGVPTDGEVAEDVVDSPELVVLRRAHLLGGAGRLGRQGADAVVRGHVLS